MHKFSTKKRYVKTDGWRGYEEPIYAVVGWNDTGSWSDSPCPTNVGLKEADLAKSFLKKNNIPFKKTTCRTSNVFCVHHYLIVPPEKIEEARALLTPWYPSVERETRLLYLVRGDK